MKSIYLARRGEVFGPYTAEEFARMRTTGEIWEYHWVWDEDKHAWAAIDLPPAPIETTGAHEIPSAPAAPVAPPPARAEKPAPEHPSKTAKAPKRSEPAPTEEQGAPPPSFKGFQSVFKLQDLPKLSAICFSLQKAAQGKIYEPTSIGCNFLIEAKREAPKFGGRAKVSLNLLDTHSGKMDTVSALIVGRTRTHAGWMYQIRWTGESSAPRKSRAASA